MMAKKLFDGAIISQAHKTINLMANVLEASK
jgi:hypothetical protein